MTSLQKPVIGMTSLQKTVTSMTWLQKNGDEYDFDPVGGVSR